MTCTHKADFKWLMAALGLAWGLSAPAQAATPASAQTPPLTSFAAFAGSGLVLDVSDIDSKDALGSPFNTVLNVQVGANALINSLSWDLQLQAFDPSWLSHIKLSLGPSSGAGLVAFTPGINDEHSGSAHYSGSANLVDYGLAFQVGEDGLLRLEFFEGVDNGVEPTDGKWLSGTLSLGVSPVPEPSSYGLMALGLMALLSARGIARRQAKGGGGGNAGREKTA
ncbi:PEP-CTERM sorting domain-containing protein [Paucibacter sp. KCTC 42545]|uniref:PEP-CTERM sorting domain-containing protein n=1 Tax=Paucibacter sp. KCTC 42545 TaxID=1768242 RepID=UPI000733A55D|nr:PEP-CTERM sorting domain-containing protein [Paucibacter sp. KCTC 42545]ALT76488.1 hypothetical protein AT984_03970 [Paucibacter sp. KCTC 42545]